MSWREDAEQGFPPQRHQEPFALRQDILDELADHLSLAAEREAELGAENEQEVRTRILNKFGDPTAVARSLWWGAMKETVVKDWIQISINALLCIAVIGFMSLFYRQMQNSNAALLGALNERSVTGESTQPSVEFVFHRGSLDGPAAEGIRARLYGSAFGGDKTYLSETSDKDGRAVFGPIHAGGYSAQHFDDITSMITQTELFTLYAKGDTETIHVVVPASAEVSLNGSSPFPAHVTNENLRLVATMDTFWSDGEYKWSHNEGRSNVMITSDGLFEIERPIGVSIWCG